MRTMEPIEWYEDYYSIGIVSQDKFVGNSIAINWWSVVRGQFSPSNTDLFEVRIR